MLVIHRLIVLLAVLGVVAAALSVGASLDSRVRLRCPNGATPQRLALLALLGVEHGLVPVGVTLTEAARRHASFDSFVRPPSRAAALEFVSHHLELLDSRRQRGLALIPELLRLGESGETSTD